MKQTIQAFACALVLPLFTFGCGPSSSSSTTPADDARSLGILDERAGTERVAEGDLQWVDPDAGMLAVTVDGVELTFAFNDETEVAGATDRIQGLTGRQGAPVVITYREAAGGRQALTIRVE